MTCVAVDGIDFFVLNMRTRMPFRYGIATLTVVPHLVVRLHARIDGLPQEGQAAEGLPPRSGSRRIPCTSFRQEVEDMLEVIRHAGELAVVVGTQPSPFDLWWAAYRAQAVWGRAQGYPPLLTGLGPSLVERALIHAVCRREGLAFGEALRGDGWDSDRRRCTLRLSGQTAAYSRSSPGGGSPCGTPWDWRITWKTARSRQTSELMTGCPSRSRRASAPTG